MAEIQMPETSQHAGRTIREIRVRHETGAIIVALRKKDGTFDTTPEPDVRIDPGDVLVGVGTADELRRLEDLFAAAENNGG
jgi:voltage-gated potassium channel